MRVLLFAIPLALIGGAYLWLNAQERNSARSDGALGVDEQPTQAEPKDPRVNEYTPLVSPDKKDPDRTTDTQVPIDLQAELRFPLEINVSLIQPGKPMADSGTAFRSGARSTLRGRLMMDNGSPLGGRVFFVAGANMGREVTCSEDGSFSANDLYPGLSVIRAVSGAGLYSEREIRLGQYGQTDVNISFGARSGARVTGRVQDELGKPVVGAQVRVDGHGVTTDEEGRFYVHRTTAGHVILEIEAEGHARFRQQLALGRGTVVGKDRFLFQLEKEAKLNLEIIGPSGGEPTYVYLFPAGGQRVNTQQGQRTFPWYTVNPIEVTPGIQNTVTGLPKGSVTLMAFQSGQLAKPERRNVKLNSGYTAAAKIVLEPGPRIRGQVLRNGKPEAGARITLEAMDVSQASLRSIGRSVAFNLEMVVGILPTARQDVRSDAHGRFQFTTQPGEQSEYRLLATNADGRYRSIMRVSADQLDGELQVNLTPTPKGTGSVTFDLPGVEVALPYRVRINGEPSKIRWAGVGESIHIPDLPMGQWRLDASRFGMVEPQGERFWVEEGETLQKPLPLPAKFWEPVR